MCDLAALRLHCIFKNWVALCGFLQIYFSLSLSHSSCLGGESQRRGGFLSEGECVVCAQDSVCFVSGLRSRPLSRASPLHWGSRCQVPSPVTRNYKSKQTKTKERTWREVTPGLWSYNTADTTLRAFLTYIMYHNMPDQLCTLRRWTDRPNAASLTSLCRWCN